MRVGLAPGEGGGPPRPCSPLSLCLANLPQVKRGPASGVGPSPCPCASPVSLAPSSLGPQPPAPPRAPPQARMPLTVLTVGCAAALACDVLNWSLPSLFFWPF